VFCFQGNEMAGSIEHDNIAYRVRLRDPHERRPAGVFRPNIEGKWPGLLTYGPYESGAGVRISSDAAAWTRVGDRRPA